MKLRYATAALDGCVLLLCEVALALAAPPPPPLQCGVASAVFSTCPDCLKTALKSGALGFWWSWGTQTELDGEALGPAAIAEAQQLFVPMLWGEGNPQSYDFLSSGSTHVMGFNEPDQFGPSCDGDWHPPAYGCEDGEWRAATSSGWQPLFDPSVGTPKNPCASQWWQWAINNMTQPAERPPPPPTPCYLEPNATACATAHWPPDPKTGKIWGRCVWNVNKCDDRRPPPPPPPAPPPPPSPGPPLPQTCQLFPNETAKGTMLTKVCAGLKLFDCCERMQQHKGCTAVVAHNGCCEYYSSLDGHRSPLQGSDVILWNASTSAPTLASTTGPAARIASTSSGTKSTLSQRRPPQSPPPPPSSWTIQNVVSPSMAQGAYVNESRSCVGANPGPDFAYCQGWLSVFKNYTLKLDCVDFQGEHTNCWDVIDNIQIHAYARTAKEVLEKIEGYRDVFAEDFEGQNGRTKKTLWLTEVAAGSSNGQFVAGFVEDLLSPSIGLMNRSLFPYVERVSWFSEFSFGSFPVGDYVPAPREAWTSSLFNPFGDLSVVGEKYFGMCSGDW